MNKPLVIAHRGASTYEEQNTLEGILLSAKQGADMIEMDVRITKDQILVLHHNNRLKLTKPKLKISSLTYQELTDHGYNLPTLKEVIEKLPDTVLINLDLKSPTMDLALKTLISKKNIEKRIFFDTDNWLVLDRYQHHFPHANFILSNSTSWDPLNVSSTFLGRAAQFLFPFILSFPLRVMFHRKLHKITTDYVTLYHRLCKKKDVEFFHSMGIKVFVFTLNKEKNLRAFIDMGVDGIKTDRPALLSEILKHR